MTATAPELVMPLLRPAFLEWLAGIAGNGVHWQVTQDPVNPPVLLVQLRDPGAVRRYVGAPAQWQSTIQVRAQAATLDAAEALVALARAAIPASAVLTDADGGTWDLELRPGAPLVSVPGKIIHTAGQTYRARLTERSA